MWFSRLTVGVACTILGLGAGVAITRRPAPEHARRGAVPAEAPSSSVVVVSPTTARLDDADKQALRAIVREELAAERAAIAPAVSATEATATDDAPKWQLSSGEMKIYDGVRASIDDAVARGTWSAEDRASLRPQIAQLPAEARVEAMRPLIVAVNEGKIHFSGRGPLF